MKRRERIEDSMMGDIVDIERLVTLGTGRVIEVEVVVHRADGTVDRYHVDTSRAT